MAELAEEAPAPPEADAAESPQAQEPAGSAEEGGSDEEYSQDSSAEEESAEEEEEEASSGDEDEKQPLSQRSAYAAKHPLPQPTAPKRTRTNRFPKIPKSQRCGSCDNCLNPQRKKACLVARQRMEEQMRLKEQQQGNGSSGGGGKSAAAAAAAPGPDPSDDPFTASLAKILSSTGGVQQERHVPLLLQLVRRARSKAHRTALLVVLQRSAGEVQRQAVAGKLLLELQSWLSDAIAEGDAKRAQNCLACLDKLPVTLAALQPPCELGKVVGKLRKHESFGAAVTDTAKRLVARWKGVVEAAQAKKAASSAGGGNASATTAAKPAAAAAAAKPAAAAAAPKPAAPKPAAASTAAHERQASASLANMADGDLFKSADRQRAGVRDAVPAVKKTVIKTLPVEAGRAKLSESAAADKEASKPGSSASVAADVSKVSASPFASLGGLGGGVTMLGGSGGSGPLGSISLSTVGPNSSSARERALAAARRVPSPEPQPKKEKAKKVSWRKEDALVGVRWFLKADPPAAAKSDADPAQLQRSTSDAAREPSPPGFESAAKKEHLSEAAALRRHRAEEDQERAELEQRLERMVATTAWLNPQPNEDLSDAKLAAMPAPPAYGEDSTEAPAAAARMQQVPRALYASPAAVPETPGEPTSLADHGVVQHPATIPRIPLSLEEAAAMQQQQAQQQQPMQQQPMQQQPMQQQPMQPAPQPMFRQQQQQSQPAAGGGLPDISAALAQLAASGVLSSVPGGGAQQQQQQPPVPMQQYQQPSPTLQQQAYPGQPGMPPQGPHMRPPPPPMGGMRPPPPGGPQQQGWQQPGPPRPPMQQAGPPRPPMQQPGPPRPPMQQAGPPRPPMQPLQGAPMQPQGPRMQQRSFGPRPCRYFNTPRGCFQGDRCNFAHVPMGGPGAENGRGPPGPLPAAGVKRPAESDAGRQGKQPRWQ